jgi:transposase-like protein
MEDISCPKCNKDNVNFEIMDELGSHYSCPDCDHYWFDPSSMLEEKEIEK